ncbi:hypothetical protein [Methylobacterium sp. yr668]|uniref:hypothetical protein n=1 Tax=Methylobacterium sp. yr668 TaxID=1761801 RepID=UPI0008E0D55A|nr:hypothetical protein [Methylobacterium sp. yr668]SFT26608.1 hypothetical protein SAMN04487845_13613 [Methylobacterium sp. yr668]
MTVHRACPSGAFNRLLGSGGGLCISALSLSAILLSHAASAADGDFTRRCEFEAQYAYLDVPAGAPAQDWIAIHAKRDGSGWRIEAVGSNPKLAASVRTCRKVFRGRTVGPGRLRATDPSGEFGTLELRREGEYVRLVSLSTGECARQGLYLVPSVQD